MSGPRHIFLGALGASLWAASALAFNPTEPGLYAVIDTSAGEIVARLHYETVPGTVANFMRLAQGSQSFLDRETGVVREEPFYDGLTFHRVAEPFGVLAGSPDGSIGGGPGYFLPSEIWAGHSFAEPGALAMYGPGIIDGVGSQVSTNTFGSQFFITTKADETDALFGAFPVFGRVIEGLSVAEAIGSAPKTGETPDNPVVIEGISFVSQGTAAAAFDPLAPVPGVVLPRVEAVDFSIDRQDESWFRLHFLNKPWSYHYFYTSRDLANWRELGVRNLQTGPAKADSLQQAWDIAGARLFYRIARGTGLPGMSLNGKTLRLAVGGEMVEIQFRAGYEADFYLQAGDTVFSGAFRTYRVWQPGYLVQLLLLYDDLLLSAGDGSYKVAQPFQLYLAFDETGTAGNALVHFLPTQEVNQGNVHFDALPARNLPGAFIIEDTPPQ